MGHVMTPEGIIPDPGKIDRLVVWPTPADVKELSQFLGFAGYYRSFVKNFASVAKPLNDLKGGERRKKGKKSIVKPKPWKWVEEEQSAFQKLKDLLVKPPVLAYPDAEGQFHLHTDASYKGLCAVRNAPLLSPAVV